MLYPGVGDNKQVPLALVWVCLPFMMSSLLSLLSVGEMETQQNALVRQVLRLTNDTLALERNFLKLKGALEMMRSFDLRVAHLLKIEGAIQQVLADKYFARLSSLMDGKVSIDFINSQVAEKEFGDLKISTFNSGFKPVFQDFSQIYQLPASYMAKEGVSVVVDIAMVCITDYGKFSLFKHNLLPFVMDGRLVKVKAENNLIAVSSNKDEFVEVLGTDLHECLHIGSVFLCHYLGVNISASFPCCPCDIFMVKTGKTKDVMRDCELTFLNERFCLDRVNSTSFLFYANSSRSGILTCGEMQEQIRLSGFGVKSLTPGCILTFVSVVAPKVKCSRWSSYFQRASCSLIRLGP